jgi:hypothetical protein
MGNNEFKLTKLALALGVTLSLSGCFSDNDNNTTVPKPPTPTVDVPVADTPEDLSFYVSGSVVQKSTGSPIAATIMFYQDGELSENVVDIDGNAISSITTEDGSFTFNLASSDVSTLKMIVSNVDDGFISKTAILDFSDVDDSEPLETLVQLTKLDSSVTTAAGTGTTTSGQLSEALSVAANADSSSATVAIGTDVVLLDASGDPVTDGEVSLSIQTADIDAATDKAKAIDLIPDGLNESSTTTVQVPVSMMNVELKAGESKVKNFSSPISLTTSLPATVNGQTIATGDTLNVMSYNEDTGEWAAENTVTVDANGNATISTEHLSGWPLLRPFPACTAVPTFTLGGYAGAVPLIIDIDTPQFSYTRRIKAGNGNLFMRAAAKLGLWNSLNAQISVRDLLGNQWGASTQLVCGPISIPVTQPYTVVSENINVTYSCSNASEGYQDDKYPFTGAIVKYAQANRIKTAATGTAGAYSLTGLQNGASYDVLFRPRGVDVEEQTFTITADGTGETFNIVRDNCELDTVPVTGGTGGTGGN